LPAAASTLPLSLPLCPPLPLLLINGAEEKEHIEAGEGGAGAGGKEVTREGGEGGVARKGETSQELSLIIQKGNEIPALNTNTSTITSTSTNTVISTNSSTLAAAAECPICLEEPGLAHSVITTCGHILCLVCAKLLIRVNKQCPICSCPLGEKDYVGLARLQQKEKTNTSSSSSSSSRTSSNGNNNSSSSDSSDNYGISGSDDIHRHEDGEKESNAGRGNGNKVMSTEMEVIHIKDSKSNCGYGEKIGMEDEKGAVASGMGGEMEERGSGCEKGGEGRGDVVVDAVRAVVEGTARGTDEIASSGNIAREAVAGTGTGTGVGAGTTIGIGSEGAVVKDSYKTDDYRRWGGERFHKSVSILTFPFIYTFHSISSSLPGYPDPHARSYRSLIFLKLICHSTLPVTFVLISFYFILNHFIVIISLDSFTCCTFLLLLPSIHSSIHSLIYQLESSGVRLARLKQGKMRKRMG
jgi:Ring finger domain